MDREKHLSQTGSLKKWFCCCMQPSTRLCLHLGPGASPSPFQDILTVPSSLLSGDQPAHVCIPSAQWPQIVSVWNRCSKYSSSFLPWRMVPGLDCLFIYTHPPGPNFSHPKLDFEKGKEVLILLGTSLAESSSCKCPLAPGP